MTDTDISFLNSLQNIIVERRDHPQEGSYTASLFAAGTQRIAQKVGEEGVEVALAACNGQPAETKGEVADLLYHLLVLLADQRITLAEVIAELQSRHASS